MNSVKLYSNGTAVICKECEFKDEQPKRISIPVRKSDLDDVISSLTVFGDVTITSPPTYTPTNAQQTELNLDPANVMRELATKLAGAEVEVEAGILYTGKLAGLHKYHREVHGSIVEYKYLVVLTQKGLQQIEESSVTALRFTEAAIQSEIDKVLRSSLGRIKPDSSLVELTIQPNSGVTSAFVTYATPVAAWKIRYQLRLSATAIELEGQAVVDNDTDDDWIETVITVITGEPITFSTDLAEIRRPARNRVNIVADRATGAVIAQSMNIGMATGGGRPVAAVAAAAPTAALRKMSQSADLSAPPPVRAVQVQAEVRESGDFSIFTSPNPVTVGAKRSAIIPLFQVAVSEAPVVLFYREGDDSQRPFRAVRMKNPATYSLGRGVCEVFSDGDFQGKCIMEPTGPGEEALLVYAKEMGVKIAKDVGRPESRRMRINISEGAIYSEDLTWRKAEYLVANSRSEPFLLEIEHSRTWDDSKLEVSVSTGECKTVNIPRGQRIRVTLEAKADLRVTVKEELIVKYQFSLDAAWLQTNVIELKTPLTKQDGILDCITLQKRIDDLQAELNDKVLAAQTIDEEQERLMKLIPNGHQEQANEWRNDLAKSEKELREIRRTAIPKLNAQIQEANKSLQKALESLQYSWSSE